MRIIQAIRSIPFGIRAGILASVGTVTLAYIYSFSASPFQRLWSICGLLVTSELMIMIWVPRIYGDIGSMFTNWKNISYEEIPEFEPFRKLAADAGVVLNRKRPFGIKKGYNNAWANPITKRIVIGDKFLQRPVKQQKALLGHELTHIKENHYWRFLIAELVVPTLVAFPLFLTKSTPIIKEVSFYAVFFMTFVLVNWHNEYSADRGGARIAGSRVAMSSLLLAIVPKKSRRVESASHPSICSRIIKLRRMKL